MIRVGKAKVTENGMYLQASPINSNGFKLITNTTIKIKNEAKIKFCSFTKIDNKQNDTKFK